MVNSIVLTWNLVIFSIMPSMPCRRIRWNCGSWDVQRVLSNTNTFLSHQPKSAEEANPACFDPIFLDLKKFEIYVLWIPSTVNRKFRAWKITSLLQIATYTTTMAYADTLKRSEPCQIILQSAATCLSPAMKHYQRGCNLFYFRPRQTDHLPDGWIKFRKHA